MDRSTESNKYKFTDKATLNNKKAINAFVGLVCPARLKLSEIIEFEIKTGRMIDALAPYVTNGIIETISL